MKINLSFLYHFKSRVQQFDGLTLHQFSTLIAPNNIFYFAEQNRSNSFETNRLYLTSNAKE